MSYTTIYTTISLFLSVAAALQSTHPSQQRRALYRCYRLPTTTHTITTNNQLCKYSLCNSFHSYTTSLFNKVQSEDDEGVEDNDNGVATLRDEIERMKQEASQKLNRLEKSFLSQSSTATSTKGVIIDDSVNKDDIEQRQSESNTLVTTLALDESTTNDSDDIFIMTSANDNFVEKTAISNKVSQAAPVAYDEMSLLDNTTWKVSLNIGREPNTWYVLLTFFHCAFIFCQINLFVIHLNTFDF